MAACYDNDVTALVGGVAQWLGRQSFPDLWLKYDHFVGKASVIGQRTRPTQPSIPDQCCVWLFVVDQSPVVAGLAYGLCARSVCDTIAPLQLGVAACGTI